MDGQGIDLVEWVYRSIDPGVGLVGQQVHQTALLVSHLKKECQLSFGTYFAVIIFFLDFYGGDLFFRNKTKNEDVKNKKSKNQIFNN